MPKISKIAVFGAKSVGKTSIIQQIVYGNYSIDKVSIHLIFLCLYQFKNQGNINILLMSDYSS